MLSSPLSSHSVHILFCPNLSRVEKGEAVEVKEEAKDGKSEEVEEM
jgi:hypothetical protein